MELYQMRYFKAVAECENISEASHRLHVSQPSLSRAIKHLEDGLGVQLFDRMGRRIVLNDKGAVFLAAVTRALESVDSVEQTLDRYVREQKRTLNILSVVPFGDDMAVLGGFKRKHPDVFVRYGEDAKPYFGGDPLDLMFYASFTDHHEPNYLKLGQEDLVLSVPVDHPLASRDEVRLADLANEQFVCVLPCPLRTVIDGMFMEAGFKPTIVLEDQHCWSMNKYVARGFGLTIAPSITWFNDEDRRRTRRIPFSDVKRTRTLYLKWAEGFELSDAAQAFCRYLQAYYRDLEA